MSGYLLDTNVISMFAPDKQPVSLPLQEWIRQESANDALYISAITAGEIQRGISKLARKGSTEKARKLTQWLSGLVAQFDSRILPVDAAVAMAAGSIEEDAESRGQRPGLADVLIAATASTNDLTVVTLNIRHFAPLGVPFMSPEDIAAL
ncbi:type II toxin-antitoxin system VapC family toxin [Rhizobium sp. S152]|uniref:type II toxin-antitoxin system VapC family toxin n=1 Tax=Rhizobium sp. S152 TaxID=3055038 RepID=UPI0025AA1433|nr:type II toxin-antitoxin system VapC family toxin [Rhizobium sp. S152]MDM9625941.1 type II toxin-antitoxin system VapC family toxin [Rhizobium sp. S152]